MVPLLRERLLTHNELLFIFCCLAFSSYPLIISGWSSYSNYSLIGTIRVVSQIISYEVVIILIILIVILFNEGFSLIDFFFFQEINKYLFILRIVIVIFYISILAELNRSPFDLIEGESELVSGFNVEYSRGLFGLIFIAEYGIIIFSRFLITFIFLGLKIYKLYFYLSFIFFNFRIIWLRGVLPRIRYDELIILCWKHILLIVLIFFYYNLIIKIIIEFLFF